MEKFESVDQVLDFAIKAEIEANLFYLDLASKSENPDIRETLGRFANEEAGHRVKLESIKHSAARSQKLIPAEKVMDLKIADYLVDIIPHPDMNYREIVILAMKKEKAAFKLYSDLAAMSETDELKSTFEFLANEEAKHKLRFEIEYDDIVLKED